jgi:hypothetical protein
MVTVIFSVVGTGVTTYFLLRYDATPWIYIPGLIATVFFIIIFIMCAYFAYKRKKTFWQFLWPSEGEDITIVNVDEEEQKLVS